MDPESQHVDNRPRSCAIVTCIPELSCSILATPRESICPGSEEASFRQAIRQKDFSNVGCWRGIVQAIAGKGSGVMRVLMAVDDSGFAEDLLRAVAVGIRHENTEVLVLHVLQSVDTVPPPEMAQGYAPELEDEKQPARALVERIAAELRGAGFAAQAEVRIGDVTETVLERAVEWNADLIAVGSHGHRNIHNFLLCSVAESIARRAGCSVVIVRTAARK